MAYLPLPPGYGTDQYNFQEQMRQQQEVLQRQADSRAVELANLMHSNQAQGIYNLNSIAQAAAGKAGTNYSLQNDLAGQRLREVGMEGQLAQNTMMNNRYVNELQLNVAQAARNQRDRATEQQQNLYQQGARPIDNASGRFRRMYGYPA